MTIRLRHVIAPVALASLALAGCQEEAPSAFAPTPTSTSPTSAVEPSQAEPTTDQPRPETESETGTDSAEPSTDTSPPTAEDTAGATTEPSASGTGGCTSTSSYDGQPGVSAKPIESTQTTNLNDGSVDITVSKATIDSSSSSSLFPGEGMVTATFPVTVKNSTATYTITTPLKFSLVDEQGSPCKRDILGYAVPKSEQLQIESLKAGDSASATLAFAVPAGADLTKYQVLFTEDYPGKADLAWTAS